MLAFMIVFFGVGVRTYRERREAADARAVQDMMKMFSLAVNTYRTDQGGYPPALFESAGERLTGKLPRNLTTPVAYVNRLINDPYATGADDSVMFYVRREDAPTTPGGAEVWTDDAFDGLVRSQIGDPVSDVHYVFWSRGPDGDLDTRENAAGEWTTERYDPTNGSDSNGDLVFWGPAIGIRRNPYLGTAAEGRGGLQ